MVAQPLCLLSILTRHGLPRSSQNRDIDMIIDIHGHYTTEPQALHQFRDKQLAGLADPAAPADHDRSRHHRRCAAAKRRAAAQTAEGARQRPDDLLAARRRHGAPRRHRGDRQSVVADLQRPHPPHLHAAARQFRRRRPAAAASRRLAEELHSRAGAHRQRARLRRRQPQPRPVGRLLDRSAAHRPALVSDLRKAGASSTCRR